MRTEEEPPLPEAEKASLDALSREGVMVPSALASDTPSAACGGGVAERHGWHRMRARGTGQARLLQPLTS
jgi:hypothetical protein